MQSALFHDCIEDALGAAIQAIGGPKKASGLLWPNDPQSRTEARIRACLNTERAERFTPGEVLRLIKLAREVGDHSILNYISTECGYQPPVSISPEDQREQLQRDLIACLAEFKQIAKRLEL